MELSTTLRTITGKKVYTLRSAGLTPGEVYGNGFENQHVSVRTADFRRLYRTAGENTVITLVNDAGTRTNVLVADVVRDAMSGDYLAIDFRAIRMDEKIRAKVPFVFVGESPAAKNGFPLVTTLNDIEVEALPAHIPHEFSIALDALTEVGSSICVKDITTPKDVKMIGNPETIIIAVTEKTKEEESTPAPAVTAEPSAVVTPTESAQS